MESAHAQQQLFTIRFTHKTDFCFFLFLQISLMNSRFDIFLNRQFIHESHSAHF